MKVRVKATGEIVDIAEYSTIYAENYDTCFYPSELEFLDVKEASDYWNRLEHQYAGMAMQGILSNNELYREICKSRNLEITIMEYAHDLVEKLKKKEENNE